MNLKREFSIAAETLVAVTLVALLVVACGGGGGSAAAQTYLASAAVGEVLEFSIYPTSLEYTYKVIETGYAASGVTQLQSSTGTLTPAVTSDTTTYPTGSYNLGRSNDGFITGGRLFTYRGTALVGDVSIGLFGSAKIPVIGFAGPSTSLANLGGIYNYQGSSCSTPGIADVTGNAACASNYGTITITTAAPSSTFATYSECQGGDITEQPNHPCAGGVVVTGLIAAMPSGTPGVYDFQDQNSNHLGWLFAFIASNGQKVAVIDYDDTVSTPNHFGNALLSPYAPVVQGAPNAVVAGSPNGSYFVADNEQGENLVAIATTTTTTPLTTVYGTSYESSAQSGVLGTMTLNSPWNGFNTFSIPASGVSPAVSGVAMVAGTGVYSHASLTDPALFAFGIGYTTGTGLGTSTGLSW